MSNETENIKSELEQLGCMHLADIQAINVFEQPNPVYFASNLIHIKEKGLLFPHSQKAIFEIPEQYFEDLAGNITDLVQTSEATEPVYFFEKQKVAAPFEVPTNYFDNLRPDFLDTEQRIYKKKEQAKVISLFQRANKYVAAAVVLVLFSIGANVMLRIKEEKKAYQLLNNMDINSELADVPTEEIFNYLNESSSKNMEYLINPKGKENPVNKMISKDQEPKGGETINGGTSDEEILQFLSDEDQGF